MKGLLLLALLPMAAEAQLTATLNGATLISDNVYSMGTVPVGTTSTALLSISNSGASCVSVNVNAGSQSGFSLDKNLGVVVPHSTPAQALNITITFSPNSSPSPQASYSTGIQISSITDNNCNVSVPPISAFLQGYGIYVPTLAASSGCSGVNPVTFGSVQTSATGTCSLVLTNSNPVPITVSADPALTGSGFTGLTGLAAQTLSPKQSIPFSISFTPPSQGIFSGTLAIVIAPSVQPSPYTLSFTLSGTGLPPPLPTPLLTFDPASYLSQQQGVLTMTLPSPAPIAATGYVNLAFAPLPSVAAVATDDSAIMFLANGARSIPFSVSKDSTNVLFGGLNSAKFGTGTTAGTITFTVETPQIPGTPPTTPITIQPAKVIIDSATASKEVLGSLVITITGADNTYSTSTMSFSFFDTSGNLMYSANADATLKFESYYATSMGPGSTFQAMVTFPVVGSVTNIGSVTVTLMNAAGVVNTGSLTFQ